MSAYNSYTTYPSLWNRSFPSHWEVIPMYAVAQEKSICDCVNLPLLSVYLDVGVIPFSAKAEKRTNVTSKDLSKYQRVDYGDFVLNNQQAWRGSVGISFDTGIVSPAYIVLSMNDRLDSKYANYLLRSRIMVDQYLINSRSVGSIQRNIYWPLLKRTSVIVPPRPEQDLIVRFLDWKVSTINKLISTTKKQIQVYEEAKKKIVGSLVIKGSDSSVPMKKSGSKWLGTIPASWRCLRAKYLFREVDDRSLTGKEELLTVSHITGITPRSEKNVTMFKSESLIGYKICKSGQIAANTMWMWQGAIAVSNYNGVISPSYNTYEQISGEYIPEYLDFLLRAKPLVDNYVALSSGIRKSRLRLYPEQFLTILFPVPPIEEQRRIVDAIKEQIAKIQGIISVRQQEISVLQEFKVRLIADVVTGKIDVRDIEVPDFKYVEETVGSSDEDDRDMGDASEDEEE